jgi:hypothetical protein
MTDEELVKARYEALRLCGEADRVLKEIDQEGDRRRGNSYYDKESNGSNERVP